MTPVESGQLLSCKGWLFIRLQTPGPIDATKKMFLVLTTSAVGLAEGNNTHLRRPNDPLLTDATDTCWYDVTRMLTAGNALASLADN